MFKIDLFYYSALSDANINEVINILLRISHAIIIVRGLL